MTTQIKTLALAALALAALWTTSCTDRQDAATPEARTFFHVYQPDPATPAEEWVASFAGQEAGDMRVININGLPYRFRWIPPGSFTMGSSKAEQDVALRSMKVQLGRDASEEERASLLDDLRTYEVQHDVTLTQGFWMLETEVTQLMHQSIMGTNPSNQHGFDLHGFNLPVDNISWEESQMFVANLNELGFAPAGASFALPTEAQWEYACRAGTTTSFSWGDSLNDDRANGNGASPYGTDEERKRSPETTPVGSYAANPWGLFDMHGNVWEWCEDWYDVYPEGSATDPRGPAGGEVRVARGGSWSLDSPACRSGRRNATNADLQIRNIGFRLVLVPLTEDTTRGDATLVKQVADPPEEWTSSIVGQEAGDLRAVEVNGVPFRFRWLPPGTFTMGSSEKEQAEVIRSYTREQVSAYVPAYGDEQIAEELTDYALLLELPALVLGETQHEVTLTQGFWMLETEVTQLMWESIMEDNPSEFEGANLPVESVSWEECQEFIAKLNELGVAPAGSRFALPTEAQWEYACRAGTATPFFWGDSLNGEKANCNGSTPYGTDGEGKNLKKTSPVGSYAANPWGLFDMHGNVWEWCEDWFGPYPTGAVVDPCGPARGLVRVVRNGGWYNIGQFCRSAHRFGHEADSTSSTGGFRIVLVPLTEAPPQAAATPEE